MKPAVPSRREFRLARGARDAYQIDKELFALDGQDLVANAHAAREVAERMNQLRDAAGTPARAVRAADITAAGLIHEVLHFAIGIYRDQTDSDVMAKALESLGSAVGDAAMELTLQRFSSLFPSIGVYRTEAQADASFAGETAGAFDRQLLLEEMLLLTVANENAAFLPFGELFDDSSLKRETAYARVPAALQRFFREMPEAGPGGETLLDMLRAPAAASPHSLEGQLRYIRDRWGHQLAGRGFDTLLLRGLDLIREAEKIGVSGPGPGPTPIYEFGAKSAFVAAARGEEAPEAFSPDLDWMPSVTLLAKNAYVWLDQLSKQYMRSISRLDEIPDEELNRLQRWGFTGLWLIGVWERSPASQRIKQLCGNPEAVASAYSLYDYKIAEDLGGQAAYDNLRARTWDRGIRMASDMVPNHVGVVSRWTIDHPDWFVSLDSSPFPSYTFNGPDLSNDERVGIFIEDHYYERTDAAVVFKRVDRWTGDERFLYHGNDGTSMPWNDTAQLNYLNPEVREAVIQTILHVARQFPIIRFDAAMTLTKQHYQRLWYPEPGSGGAIPTRAENGLTTEQFDAAMPAEFWREVVDRVAAEAPDTLLLAEAFWLLEGYFVRSLGMHRVYNSAFMHMLRDQDNAGYRQLMKNTLEYDPEILRRFVNFMSNPDERTAIDQFGTGDKYLGVCTVLLTMPGLPMFGHGQVEAYAEKYGMEYRRAYFDERPNEGVIAMHEHAIFPLMRIRRTFAGVDYFRLYDFHASGGGVNEDVYAYSNRLGDARSLVIYHNAYAETSGWINRSVVFARRTGDGDEKTAATQSLVDALELRAVDGWFSIFRDQVSGLQYLRRNSDLAAHGLYVELGAYRRHVFLDFQQVAETAERQYGALEGQLGGQGVVSIEEALAELAFRPATDAFEGVFASAGFRAVLRGEHAAPGEEADEFASRLGRFYQVALSVSPDTASALAASALLRMERLLPDGGSAGGPVPRLAPVNRAAVAARAILKELGEEAAGAAAREWLTTRKLAEQLRGAEFRDDDAVRAEWLTRLALRWEHDLTKQRHRPGSDRSLIEAWFDDRETSSYLGVNEYEGVAWFNRERWEELLDTLEVVVGIPAPVAREVSAPPEQEPAESGTLRRLRNAAANSGWRLDSLLNGLVEPQATGSG